MKSVINWFEIPVSDMDRAIKFYEPVMQLALRREKMDCAELAVFLHTDNLAATLDRIASAGGECVFGPLELPHGIGTIALFTDSEGNRVGLHQPA